MPNTFTTTTTTGYGTRIGKSFGGVILGILLFFGSFVVLYMNEGRTDLSEIAKKAADVTSSAESRAAGSLVSASGTVTTKETLGDDLFLKPGSYLAVHRTVEMYAWVEDKKESSSTNVGGSETTTTTYNYTMEWTEQPAAPSDMEHPEEHENPALPYESDDFEAASMKVGNYTVGGTVSVPSGTELTLTKDLVTLTNGAVLSGGYVFDGAGTMSSPKLGDVRVSYQVLKPGFDGTVFGALSGSSIVKYENDNGDVLFRLFDGSRTAAIATMHGEYVTMGWILRLVGFLMMWFGLMGVLGPISTILDVLPILGSGSRFMVGVVTLPIALVLSAVTILVAMIAHSAIALLVTVLVLIGIGIGGAKMMKKPAPSAM